jgi:site-specific recombinase XerD
MTASSPERLWTVRGGGATLRLLPGCNLEDELGGNVMETVRAASQRWLRERFVSGEISGRTRSLLECRFPAFLDLHGDLPVGELDRAALRAWSRKIGHLAPASRRAYLSTVGCFCRWAVEEGLLDEDPTRHVPRIREPRRVPRSRPADDIAAIYAVCRRPRDRAIVALMVQMGLRSIEVARLETGDFDTRARTVLVKGKGDHERVLPVPARAVEELRIYRDTLGDRSGPLICDVRSGRRPLTSAAVAQIVSRLMRRAGVKHFGGDGVTPHTLRHTAASDVLDYCNNVRTVQRMLGHASLATTEIYLRRASLEQLREAMEGRDYQATA